MVLYSESPTPSIRPARSADLPAIAAIFAHYVETSVVTFEETPPTAADWADKLAGLHDRGLPFLVADTAGTVAGYAYAAPWRPKPAYRHTAENTVYLSPAHTGRGLGRTLMAALIDACAAAGVRQLVAVVVDDGAGTSPSLALHRALGFAEAGRLTAVGHKHGRWLDTVLLQRAV
ncbi:GNAT family N-acetyltransferase [Jiangella rhizosphaerae]|uniref:N-acetyltransferase family protein n=1 Tax=Jiangella rhizosphaerae TaxID=2293569 RepID=A0A418KLW5_9ACTN|nr:GNAT family N-acetyltransferase [Jiangella rhizosphaerae]RIQ18925.1 N-acetyltransferase family protein [Jiangella rhizosphaerae]